MEKVIIVRPSIDEYVNRVYTIAQRYSECWLDLYTNPEQSKKMSEDDWEDFDFLCTAFWDTLTEREFSQSPLVDTSPPNIIKASIEENPKYDLGFSFCEAVSNWVLKNTLNKSIGCLEPANSSRMEPTFQAR